LHITTSYRSAVCPKIKESRSFVFAAIAFDARKGFLFFIILVLPKSMVTFFV
jgi:hypothetical protein